MITTFLRGFFVNIYIITHEGRYIRETCSYAYFSVTLAICNFYLMQTIVDHRQKGIFTLQYMKYILYETTFVYFIKSINKY